MTEGKNIFSRFFRMLVMLHKIPYAHFTEWNNKRKHKALAAGVYCLSIIPEYVLLAGTFLAARGQDGYVHLVNVPQKVVFYGLAGLAVLLSAIPMASENTVPAEKEQVEVPQSYRDYLSLHFKIGARQEAPNEALQRQIDQDERTTRYGQPVYAMQVRATKGDMDGGFRARLLNHATIDEIRDGTRKFAECTWGKGYTSDSIRILLTVWYEMKKVELCPVDSLEWTEDTRF